MTTTTCLCHYPDGTESISEVDGELFTRGSQVTLDRDESAWYVTKHTPTAAVMEETIARPFDAEIWIDREAPPLPIAH
jgi:hypothetical protein